MTNAQLSKENSYLKKELANVREKLNSAEPKFYREELARLEAQYQPQIDNLRLALNESRRKITKLRELINQLKTEADQ